MCFKGSEYTPGQRGCCQRGGEDPVGSISEQELWLFVEALGKRTGLSVGVSLHCSHANGRVTQYNTINKPLHRHYGPTCAITA